MKRLGQPRVEDFFKDIRKYHKAYSIKMKTPVSFVLVGVYLCAFIFIKMNQDSLTESHQIFIFILTL
ncbi:hypothetical protein SMUE_23310 [Enterococcus cecorum]